MAPVRTVPVNISSVPQRSPLRYPGGKTWLVPYVRQWLRSLSYTPDCLVEPFAGGGIISLTVAFERLTRRSLMIEIDEHIASVWRTILGEDGEWLAKRIADFKFTEESVSRELSKHTRVERTTAFQTILRNRVSRGGILAPGSGLLKMGENGKGLGSRWYPETLKKRIMEILRIRDRVSFVHGDGLQALQDYSKSERMVFFIDPPYIAPNKKRLYTHADVDHEELFRTVAGLTGDFLMTYDVADKAYELALAYKFDTEMIVMRSTHNVEMPELLIGRSLGWLRKEG